MLRKNLLSKKSVAVLAMVLFFGAICFGSIGTAIAGQVCEGDFDTDGDVDGSDLAVFAADFGRTNCNVRPVCEGDFNGDNDVDGSDLAIFAGDFGRTDCLLPVSTAAEIADVHAAGVWEEDKTRGEPFLLWGKDGTPFAYVFPYALNATHFPTYNEIFDAVREALAIYPRTDTRFYSELERIIGSIVCVEVSATRSNFPVLVVRHALHPYFLYAEEATYLAMQRMGTSAVTLRNVEFNGPHELYFNFAAPRKLLQLHAVLLKTKDELQPIPMQPAATAVETESSVQTQDGVKNAWEEIDNQTYGEEEHTVKWIDNYRLVPVVDWTHWCVPTAMTMTAGFWDHYVPGYGTYTGWGRIIDYWFDHPAICQNDNVTNVPNFIDEIITHSTCSWSSQGFLGTLNTTNNYNFTWTNTAGTPFNNFGWPLITSEVDAGRPAVWGVGPVHPHAMTAIGYRIVGSQKFVVVYNTWGATAKEQLAEYNYGQWNNAANTQTGVGRLLPGGGTGDNHAVLHYPRGEEVLLGSTQISWYVWGSDIKYAVILFSKDGGTTWSVLNSWFLPTTPGWNTYNAVLNDITSKGRIKIHFFNDSLDYIAGDGSPKNFYVQGKPDLIPIPTCQTDSQGRLIVRVKNQGTVSAAASVTKVEFFPGGVFNLNFPSIAVGATAEVPLPIPGLCWNADCDYHITVDLFNQIDEANEGNNSAPGACLG